MNKEEICFKLIEFYYTNKSMFNNCCMGLTDLFKKYNKCFIYGCYLWVLYII